MKFEIHGFEMKYWEGVADIWLSPECQWGGLQLPLQSRDAIRKTLEHAPATTTRLVAIEKEQGRVIGTLSLGQMSGRRSHAAEVGLLVRDDFKGKGIGSALLSSGIDFAENWLGLHRLSLIVYPDNERAIHLYERNGFKIEGRLLCAVRRAGRLVDAYMMARLNANLPEERSLSPGIVQFNHARPDTTAASAGPQQQPLGMSPANPTTECPTTF